MLELIIGADNLITIDKLMVPQSSPPIYINAGTVTWQLFNSNNTVIGSGSYAYTPSSNGQWTTTILQSLTTTLTLNNIYTLKTNVVATGFTSLLQDSYIAANPSSIQFTYCVRSDIENEFGAVNVEKWADIDNDGDAQKIDARINWALLLTYDEINSKLLGGIYNIPLQGRYPLITHVQAVLAAVRLYESRGMTNTDEQGNPIHQLSTHEKKAWNTIAMLRAGILRLALALPQDIIGTAIPLPIRTMRRNRYASSFNWPYC